MKKSFWVILVVIVSAFAAINISAKNLDKKNQPVGQLLKEADIAVTAPPLVKQEALEQRTKEKLKDKAENIYYYSSTYKKADYLIYYCEYKHEVKLQTGIDSVVARFKDNNFQYEVIENEITDSAEGMLLEGSFEKDNEKFGIKQQLIKKDKTRFWQVLTIYPYSDKNDKTAEEFIKSVSVGSSELKK